MIATTMTDQRVARILVVDDEPDICTICTMALRRSNDVVATAGTPEEALHLLATDSFDLLLTDILMPAMTGLELARRAQQIQPLLDVVIMTAQASSSVLEDALKNGIADFLPKPFDVDQLRLTIARTLQRQRLRRENVRLSTLTHVIEASRAFAHSLDQADVATALIAALQRETGLQCIHVVLDSGSVYPAAGEDGCSYPHDGAVPPNALIAPLTAHGGQLGQVWLIPAAGQPEPQPTEVMLLLLEHGSLALYNADVYATLADLDHQKSEFIALASHELRTPLAVVLGYAAMLRDSLEGRQQEQVTEITRAALRINDVVDDLINMRQLEANEVTIRPQSIRLQSLIRTLCAQLQPLAQERGVELLSRAPRRVINFWGDHERLLLALTHLVNNGLRFTPSGGRVIVTAGQQRAEQGGNLVIAVDDTGIGIESHQIHRIFQRFYQVSDSRTREEGGLGIGLALARTIIELHGGSLTAQSVPGSGSRFVVVLPIAPVSEPVDDDAHTA